MISEVNRRRLNDNPRHWISNAAEMRSLACQATNMKGRDRLLNVAAKYENLAKRAATRAGTKSTTEY